MSGDNRRVKVSSSRIIDYRSLNEQQVEDITLDFFYKPHTLTLLSVLLLALLYTACTRDNSDETLNVYHGVLTIRYVTYRMSDYYKLTIYSLSFITIKLIFL